MNKALVVLVLFACLAVYSAQQRPCPKNQVFKTCGTRCPPICNVPPRPCTKECVRDCFCKDGFILKSSGSKVCIDKRNCTRF